MREYEIAYPVLWVLEDKGWIYELLFVFKNPRRTFWAVDFWEISNWGELFL